MATRSRKGVLANWLVPTWRIVLPGMRASWRLPVKRCDAASSRLPSSSLPSSSSASVRASGRVLTAPMDGAEAGVLELEGAEGAEGGGTY